MSQPNVVPEDQKKLGFDVLNGRINQRTNCIHNALAVSQEPQSALEIGAQAEAIAARTGLHFNEKTYSETVTYNHLRKMRSRGYVERTQDGRWRLSDLARQRIEGTSDASTSMTRQEMNRIPKAEVASTSRTDRQARLTLPDDFANQFVIVERIGEQELRIRKANVRAKQYSLAELLAKVTDENRHPEISTGHAVGREAEE